MMMTKKNQKDEKKKEYWKFIQNNPSSEWTDKTLENYAAALKMPKKKITMRLFFVPLFDEIHEENPRFGG